MVNLAMIGSRYDAQTVNGLGLSNLLIGMIPFTVMIGFNGALDTFLSQTFGSQDYQKAGLYVKTAQLLMICFFIPLLIVFLNTKDLLVSIGQDEEASNKA